MAARSSVTAVVTNGSDRWRTGMLVLLLLAQTVIVWEQCPGTWRGIAAWLADADQRAYTRPFWLHLTIVAVTLSNVALLGGAIGALVASGAAASRRWLLGAFAVHLVLQIAPRLPPMAWSYAFPPAMQEQGASILAAAAPLEAVAGVIDLLPLLLAVTLGVIRAGLHQVRVRPLQPIGPVMVFTCTLQLALLAAMGLTFVAPLLPQTWLQTGLLLLTCHYGLATAIWFLLARQPRGGERWLRVLLWLCDVGLQLPGWGVLLYGLESVEVLGQHLVGFGAQPGLVASSELPMLGALFLGRALATALAANDLIERSRGEAV